MEDFSITCMAIPICYEKRKEAAGYGNDGKLYPSVRLWTRTGKMPTSNKKNGLGVHVYMTEDADHAGATDLTKVRMAWRRFAHRPSSYNWQKKVEMCQKMYDKAAGGGEGNVTCMLVYRVPRYRWAATDDDVIITDPAEESSGESTDSGKPKPSL